ncbi:MAG: hypothetical protein HKM28_01575, partial [Flavobacteriaceae bacterium]|nr:hypothetical protein [Flavobacteriaceae bacterium]
MCTLTFLPNAHGFILTSNRDEAPGRATLAPQEYTVEGVKLVFPKDVVAGGTWIGLSEKDRLICLLNGGFEAHQRESAYRLSRGVVVKDLLITDDIISSIEAYDLNGVEPFTIILTKWESALELYELVW